jgi:hypothetical protein
VQASANGRETHETSAPSGPATTSCSAAPGGTIG